MRGNTIISGGTAAGSSYIGTNNAQDFVIATTGVERARILANGTINIPTTLATGPGIITQNSVLYIHSFGGPFNFFAGPNAGNLTNVSSNNTGIGASALIALTGGLQNTAVGAAAMLANQGGGQNTGIGDNALRNNVSGSQNAALGYNAGQANIGGSSNTFIGSSADASSGAFTNATAIGSNATVGASNSLVLGSTAPATNVGAAISIPTSTLTSGGSLAAATRAGGSTTLTVSDFFYHVTVAGATTVTLPSAVSAPGRIYVIKTDPAGGPTTVNTAGGLIDGAATALIATNNGTSQFISDGTNWNLISIN